MMVSDIGGWLAPLMSMTLGTDMFINWQPEEPDQILVLSDYSHDAPDLTFGTSAPFSEHPRLQVLVRDLPMEVVNAEARCRTAYEFLCGLADTQLVIGGSRFTCIPMQTPTMIGRDAQQRVLYVANFQTTES